MLKGNALTLVYSALIIGLGYFYKLRAVNRTEEENHRYWKHYDDALINRLFIFNSLNFYFPMVFIALDIGNPGNFDQLFTLLLS